MRIFIFVSVDGYTYQPNSESIEPDVQNMQVIGIASGENESAALENLILENEWIKQSSFDEVIAYELLQENPIMKCSLPKMP